jgi:hypothetical protein
MPPVRKPATRKRPAKRTSAPRSAGRSAAGAKGRPAAHARFERNGRAIRRIKDALELTQKEMGTIRGSIQAGGKDLRKDAAKLLRDARREVEKMNKATLRDLGRLRKDGAAARKTKAAPKATTRRRRSSTGAGRRKPSK